MNISSEIIIFIILIALYFTLILTTYNVIIIGRKLRQMLRIIRLLNYNRTTDAKSLLNLMQQLEAHLRIAEGDIDTLRTLMNMLIDSDIKLDKFKKLLNELNDNSKTISKGSKNGR